MQNPRVSLPSVGAREVRHGNTHPTTQTELNKLARKADRNGGCDRCTRDGADIDWPKGCCRRSPTANRDFLSLFKCATICQHTENISIDLRAAEVKSFPAIPKATRSVNSCRDRNGANLKMWSVLLVCTIFGMIWCQQKTSSQFFPQKYLQKFNCILFSNSLLPARLQC